MVRYLCLVFVILKDFSGKINLLGNFKILKVVLVKLIGVNTGRPVTLKYLSILLKILKNTDYLFFLSICSLALSTSKSDFKRRIHSTHTWKTYKLISITELVHGHPQRDHH